MKKKISYDDLLKIINNSCTYYDDQDERCEYPTINKNTLIEDIDKWFKKHGKSKTNT